MGASTELKEGMRSFGQLLTWSIYSILTYTMIIIIYRTSRACGFTIACSWKCKEHRQTIRQNQAQFLRKMVETKSEDPNAVYKNEIHEEEMPRNLKQIQNLRNRPAAGIMVGRQDFAEFDKGM